MCLWAATSLALALGGCGTAPESATFEPGVIEARYAESGPEAVTTSIIGDDAGNDLYKIYHPTDLKAGLPLIVWGNGTGASPATYDALLTHLATWGFVVVDTYVKNTGTGAEILAAAEYMVAESGASDSKFYGKIDASKVGLAGHSQGSTGVINAHTNFEHGSMVKAVVSIALPALKWCDPEDVYDTSRLSVPFLLLGGTGDGIISPVESNQAAFDGTPKSLPAVMGMAIGSEHSEIEGDGGRHRGYLTAWMRFQLLGIRPQRPPSPETAPSC